MSLTIPAIPDPAPPSSATAGSAVPVVDAPSAGSKRWPRACRVRRALWPAYARWLASGSDPILVGPWRGELGYEVFYWQPWVARFAERFKIPASRLIPIGRAGSAVFYGAPQGLELYAMRDPRDVSVQTRLDRTRTGWAKQLDITAWDRAVLADAAKTLGLRRPKVLHPAWLYADIEPFLMTQRGLQWLHPRLKLDTLTVPALPEGLSLPPAFLAVRYYTRATFPITPLTTSFARESIRQMAKMCPIVLLNYRETHDDHLDYAPPPMDNVTRLADLTPLTAENVLGVQAAVMAASQGFIGTYGGMAHLAQRLGKPMVSFYTEWQATTIANLQLTQSMALSGTQPGLVLRVSDAAVLQQVVPPLSFQAKPASVRSSAVAAPAVG